MTDYRQLRVPPSLWLSIAQESDAPALFALIQAERSRLGQHLGWPASVCHVEDQLATIRLNRLAFAEGRSAVYLLRWNQEIAGVLSFNCFIGRQGEIGYWLGSKFEGRGIMAAAVSALIEWYGASGRLEEFILRCGTENLRSNRLAQRLGFRFERLQPRGEKIGDHYVDHNVYHLHYANR